jgi:regulator of protease activity HflC (stomatin/prohibitin superfamily)
MTSLSIFLCLAGVIFLAALLLVSLSVRMVPNGKRLAVYRLGEYLGDKGPGIVILIPFIDRGVIKMLDSTDEAANKDH